MIWEKLDPKPQALGASSTVSSTPPMRFAGRSTAFAATKELKGKARYGLMASGTTFLTDLALPLTSPSRTVTWMGGVNAKR